MTSDVEGNGCDAGLPSAMEDLKVLRVSCCLEEKGLGNTNDVFYYTIIWLLDVQLFQESEILCESTNVCIKIMTFLGSNRVRFCGEDWALSKRRCRRLQMHVQLIFQMSNKSQNDDDA